MVTPVFKDHVCDRCTLINSTEDIFIPPKIFKKVGRKPIFIGTFTKVGHSDHSYYYIFKCSACGKIVIDSPHGYREGKLFLEHRGCPNGTEINGIRITHLLMEERNLKELMKMVHTHRAVSRENKVLNFNGIVLWVILGAALLFLLANLF